jgi:hypothetical protein
MSKKEETKKQLQNKKNRKLNEIFRNVKTMLDQVDIAAPEYAAPAPPPPAPAEQEIWSAKVQQIKNINTGRRRAAQDKWNRFAGTSGAGGRGR